MARFLSFSRVSRRLIRSRRTSGILCVRSPHLVSPRGGVGVGHPMFCVYLFSDLVVLCRRLCVVRRRCFRLGFFLFLSHPPRVLVIAVTTPARKKGYRPYHTMQQVLFPSDGFAYFGLYTVWTGKSHGWDAFPGVVSVVMVVVVLFFW